MLSLSTMNCQALTPNAVESLRHISGCWRQGPVLVMDGNNDRKKDVVHRRRPSCIEDIAHFTSWRPGQGLRLIVAPDRAKISERFYHQISLEGLCGNRLGTVDVPLGGHLAVHAGPCAECSYAMAWILVLSPPRERPMALSLSFLPSAEYWWARISHSFPKGRSRP